MKNLTAITATLRAALQVKAAKHRRRGTRRNTRSYWSGLNDKLREAEIPGFVCTALTFDKNGKQINIFGWPFDDSIILRALNMTIGARGTKLTGKISHRKWFEFRGEKGVFVPSRYFGHFKVHQWVALVGIKVNPDLPDAVPFS